MTENQNIQTTGKASSTESRARKLRTESLGFLFLVGGILLALNVLAVYFYFRIDATDSKKYSLSNGSKNVVQRLDEDLEVTGYFSPDLPRELSVLERGVRDLVEEYQSSSKGKVKVRFIQVPKDDEKKQKEAEEKGIAKSPIQSFENDQVQLINAYRGLQLKYQGETRTVSPINSIEGLEYELTQKIKELTKNTVKIGLVKNGGAAPTVSLIRSALTWYTFEEVDANSPISQDYKTLLVVDPGSEFTPGEVGNIRSYLKAGGSLGLFGGTVKVEKEQQNPQFAMFNLPQESHAKAVTTNVNSIIDGLGVEVRQNLIFSGDAQKEPRMTMQGFVLVPYPPHPVVRLGDEKKNHPVFYQIPAYVSFFTSTLKLDNAAFKTNGGKVLARVNEESWAMPPTTSLSHEQNWPAVLSPNPKGAFPIAVAFDGYLTLDGQKSDKKSKVLVISTGALFTDEIFQDRNLREIAQSAAMVAQNSIDWLAGDNDLIAMRTRNLDDPPLEVPPGALKAQEQIQEAQAAQDEAKFKKAQEEGKAAIEAWEVKKSMYRWGNVVGVPLLFALFGLIRYSMRKNAKSKVVL